MFMKKIYLLLLVIFISFRGLAQFVTMPLDYPDDGTAYQSWFTSIVDDDNIWVGTVHQGFNGYLPYSDAVKTLDGGETWEFKSIPVPGTPWIQHLSAWDATTCYYLFIDGDTYEGAVWKTADGGDSWNKITTTQFQGGWPNSIHCFSADTVLVIGDPNGGYFELQITYDGGNTWTRVPQSDVPSSLTGEWGLQGEYYAVGNSVWFGTSKGRCIHSSDRGLHWQATQVSDQYLKFCFSDSLNGIAYRPGTSDAFFKTTDGGNTWSGLPVYGGYDYTSMSNVPGINTGFVVTAVDTANTDSLMVFYSTDFFSTASMIDSNLTNTSNINFKSPTNGWIGGSYLWYHNIHKYTGVLTSLYEASVNPGMISIAPNPTRDKAFIRIPGSWIGKYAELYIHDLTGRTIHHQALGNLQGLVHLSSSGIPDGMYIIQIVTTGGENLTSKWVIRR
jgi:photosystem II stability/assembly factor-like uncharacterized protein